jgi:hypothetical protein
MPPPSPPPRAPTSPKTSLETEASFDKTHLMTLLEKLGDGVRARAIQQCSTTFRTLTCPGRHLAHKIPTARCGHRLCPDCTRWHRQRAVNRLRPDHGHPPPPDTQGGRSERPDLRAQTDRPPRLGAGAAPRLPWSRTGKRSGADSRRRAPSPPATPAGGRGGLLPTQEHSRRRGCG